MNIHLQAGLVFFVGTRFWPTACWSMDQDTGRGQKREELCVLWVIKYGGIDGCNITAIDLTLVRSFEQENQRVNKKC